ncbi:hypothetical protein GCM10007866_23680 [Gluconobacter albidus]|uniref:Uncharacterized protein n=1 Tax=Gluconobacter albidus TaxID=318683 RepID=A0ABQ5X279_9PROT|nr:hypothetical protein AA3250_1818 [Gluconobacter albidus NBRC 3250]GLQ69915.1 hypothetical protein GCM10007866_23680 [Gluconobacter albidus]
MDADRPPDGFCFRCGLALFADVAEKSPVWDDIRPVWAILPGEYPMPTVAVFFVAGRSFAHGS